MLIILKYEKQINLKDLQEDLEFENINYFWDGSCFLLNMEPVSSELNSTLLDLLIDRVVSFMILETEEEFPNLTQQSEFTIE